MTTSTKIIIASSVIAITGIIIILKSEEDMLTTLALMTLILSIVITYQNYVDKIKKKFREYKARIQSEAGYILHNNNGIMSIKVVEGKYLASIRKYMITVDGVMIGIIDANKFRKTSKELRPIINNDILAMKNKELKRKLYNLKKKYDTRQLQSRTRPLQIQEN